LQPAEKTVTKRDNGVLAAEEDMSVVPMPEIEATVRREFEEIFSQYSRFVYRTAYAVTGRHEDAEDVLQTIFLRLARQELSPELLKNPKPYLYRSAVNVSFNVLRSRRRAASLQDAAQYQQPERAPDAMFDEELCTRLREAIGQLKPEAAEILLLRYTHNHSDAEIARMLGVSRGTIALKLFRLRARLKKLLRAAMGGKA
jgi:RNA polymerase sigma-70 factor (ECF subfamily)